MVVLFLVLLLSISLVPFPQVEAAAGDYVSASTSINPTEILTGEETEVTLNIKGTPPVNIVKPNDVILVIDKSGSMGTEKMDAAKKSAKGFIDLMDLKQHRVGIADYSDVLSSYELTDNANEVKAYIDTLKSGGGTNTGDAIQLATELLVDHRPEAQPVIVLLTDGEATGVGDGLNAFDYTLKKANEAKDAGIVFYTIALLNADANPETSAPNILLKNMATTAHHHHFVLGSVGLAEIYEAIVKEIGLASAYDVVVTEVVNSAFEIVPGSYDNNIPKPVVDGNTLTWNFLELKNDSLQFTFKIRHKLEKGPGTFPVTTSASIITYKDYAGAAKQYKIPSANVIVKNPAPIITSVTPSNSHISGGEVVTITGENFLPDPKIRFGGSNGREITYISDKEIQVTTPPVKQGKTTITLTNTDNQSTTADFTYYADPEVSSISPNKGPISGGTKLTINGQYFLPGVKVKVGENYAPTVTYHSSIYLYAYTPEVEEPGTVDITIENPDGTQLNLPGAFTYEPLPSVELVSISPAEGAITGGTSVTLTGKLFKSTSKVYFNNVEAASVSYVSATQLAVKTPSWAQPETVDVKVVNNDETESILPLAFTYTEPPAPNAPLVTGISPDNGALAGGTTVYVDGKYFVSGVKVFIGGSTAIEGNYVNSTRLTFKTPAWNTPETVDITIENPDGQSHVLPGAYTYNAPPEKPAPVITGMSPANGPLGGGTTVYVDGKSFTTSTKLYFLIDGQEVDLNATYVNSTRLMAKTPSATNPGPVDVKAANDDGKSGVLAGGFTYDAPPVYPDPIITSLSPNQGSKRGGGLIDIYGQDFQRGARVVLGNEQLELSAYLSKTNVRVKAPAVSTAGPVDVTIINPDGKLFTLTGGYTYLDDLPVITAISPNSGPIAGGTNIYIDGKYFTSDMIVMLDHVEINYTYVNSTRIVVKTPAASVPGAVELTVSSVSGASSTTTFTYEAPPAVPAPTITGVSPATGPLKGGTTIYIDGKNLKSGAKIVFNGVQYSATYVNSTRVYFKTPASATAGIVSFYIVNPDGQQSGTLNFEYK